jgi:hypothetical protein
MRTLSSVAKMHPALPKAPAIDAKLTAWTILAAILVVVAIVAVALSPAPDMNGIAAMDLMGP